MILFLLDHIFIGFSLTPLGFLVIEMAFLIVITPVQFSELLSVAEGRGQNGDRGHTRTLNRLLKIHSRRFMGVRLRHKLRDEYCIITQEARGHSAQSDLFWRAHQYATLCCLLMALCNWGENLNQIQSNLIPFYLI